MDTPKEHERTYIERIVCSPSTRKLLEKECRAEFLKHHPDMKGVRLSNDYILRRVCNYYLDRSDAREY